MRRIVCRVRQIVKIWENAREKYAAGNFAGACEILVSLREAFPETKLYAVFCDRVQSLLKKPPFDDWNGIWTGAYE